MAREAMSDLEVQMEIERLKQSPHVKLAEKEIRLRYKERKWLYQLRYLEKRGKQLEADGMTLESIENKIASIPLEDE